jgi:hypothetical protein
MLSAAINPYLIQFQIVAALRYDNTLNPRMAAFLDLYILWPSDSLMTRMDPKCIAMAHIPNPVTFNESLHIFVPALPTTDPAHNFRIFDSTAVPLQQGPATFRAIHLSPMLNFGVHIDGSKFYWRLPGCSAGAFIGAVFQQVVLTQTTQTWLKLLVSQLYSRGQGLPAQTSLFPQNMGAIAGPSAGPSIQSHVDEASPPSSCCSSPPDIYGKTSSSVGMLPHSFHCRHYA